MVYQVLKTSLQFINSYKIFHNKDRLSAEILSREMQKQLIKIPDIPIFYTEAGKYNAA